MTTLRPAVPHDRSRLAPREAAAAAAAPRRQWRERLRVLLDPPEAERQPGKIARLLASWRAFTRTHVQVIDGAAAFTLCALGLSSAIPGKDWIPAGVLTILLALPLAWRRSFPITVFLVIAAAAFVQWIGDLRLFADVALLSSLFTVAATRPRRAAVAGALILEGGAVLAAIRWGQSSVATFAFLSGLVVAAFASGLYVRARRLYVASLVERAARLEFERDQQALLAAAAERARISREMHDVMAHSLAVVISLANGAAAKLGRDPEQSREALESISELGREALADTRRLLSVLRTDEDPAVRGPQPGIEQIADLVDHAASTGLAATLSVRGDPVPVAPGLALSAYRIIQEAITNAVKHAAGATTVAVELTWTPCRLKIAVRDNGRADGGPGGSSNGFGLAGIRERAALYGGTATAGQGPEGGWTVRASMPIISQGSP